MTRQPMTVALRGASPTVHQTTRHQIPAVSPPLPRSGVSPQARRPAAEHGGAGEPTHPRPGALERDRVPAPVRRVAAAPNSGRRLLPAAVATRREVREDGEESGVPR